MGTLILQDGTVFKGNSFGAIGGYMAEIVFNTSMAGYQGIISDPVYAKQIVVFSYPEIGNCGINDYDNESDNSLITGIVVKNNCLTESHYRSSDTLSNYLRNKNIIALEGIDTRKLIKKISEYGTMNAFITSNEVDNEFINEKILELEDYLIDKDIINEISCKARYVYNSTGKINVALYDYGVKKSLLTALAKRDCKITVYPSTTPASEILENNYDAVFLSGGPGNPENYSLQISQVKQLMGKTRIFATGLGCQIAALALGAKVYKLKCGHRGSNHSVINIENNKVMMTTQSHGYAIDKENITKFMQPTYKNLNDNTIEGFDVPSLGIYAVQFHPEANQGLIDLDCIFDGWINIIQKDINRINEVKNER